MIFPQKNRGYLRHFVDILCLFVDMLYFFSICNILCTILTKRFHYPLIPHISNLDVDLALQAQYVLRFLERQKNSPARFQMQSASHLGKAFSLHDILWILYDFLSKILSMLTSFTLSTNISHAFASSSGVG